MFPESAADTVERYRVDAGVDEAETEADDPKGVPEVVVDLCGLGIEVEPQHEDVVGQEAEDEDDDEGQHHLGDFLPSPDLCRLALHLPRHVPGAQLQVSGHKDVEEGDDAEGNGVIGQEFEQHHHLQVSSAEFFWVRETYLQSHQYNNNDNNDDNNNNNNNNKTIIINMDSTDQ